MNSWAIQGDGDLLMFRSFQGRPLGRSVSFGPDRWATEADAFTEPVEFFLAKGLVHAFEPSERSNGARRRGLSFLQRRSHT